MPGLGDIFNLGGLGSNAQSWNEQNPGALVAIGSGIMHGSLGNGFAAAAPIVAQGKRHNQTAQFLMQRGIAKTPEEAMTLAKDPQLIGLVMKDPDPYTERAAAWERFGGDPNDPRKMDFLLTGDLKEPAEAKPPKIEEFFDAAGAPYKGIYDPATDTVKKIGGSRVSGATETQRNNLSKARQAATSLEGSLDAYEKLATGVTVMPGEAKDNLLQARTDIMLQAKELYELGVLNGPDYELMKNMIFDPTINIDPDRPWATVGDIGSKVLGGDIATRTKNSITKFKQIIKRNLDAAEATNPANRGNGMDGTVPPPGGEETWVRGPDGKLVRQ